MDPSFRWGDNWSEARVTTRHLVDPELLPTLDVYPGPAREMEALSARRDALKTMLPARETYQPQDIAIEDHVVPGPQGAPDVPVILYRPLGIEGPLPAYLHIHGGGYVFGNAEMCGPQNVRTATEAECITVSVDYRLAPETRAPNSVEDCYAALAWLHDEADRLGVDRSRIAIGGESAGGGLAAALALLARDQDEIPICFQMLLAPMVDDRTCAAAIDATVGEFVWTRDSNAFGWQSLLGCEPGAPDVPAYCAAARAGDLSGLPPTYIAVGALDLFRDEDIAYAQRLLRAGVPTELHVIPGAYHGYEMAADTALVQRAQAERLAALKRALHRSSES
jgi:acetyl esterase/lipase